MFQADTRRRRHMSHFQALHHILHVAKICVRGHPPRLTLRHRRLQYHRHLSWTRGRCRTAMASSTHGFCRRHLLPCRVVGVCTSSRPNVNSYIVHLRLRSVLREACIALSPLYRPFDKAASGVGGYPITAEFGFLQFGLQYGLWAPCDCALC